MEGEQGNQNQGKERKLHEQAFVGPRNYTPHSRGLLRRKLSLRPGRRG
jgi:hypothetical protein